MDDLTKRALNAFDTASRLGAVTAKNMPYYKHTYADMVLSTIAECHKDKSTITWAAGGQSYNTLYLKWRQARQYIKDNMPEAAAALDTIKVTRIQNVGVKFTPILDPINVTESDNSWRSPLIDYIEQASPGEPPFERIGIGFSTEDHDWIKNIIRPVMDQFIITLQSDRISIMRT